MKKILAFILVLVLALSLAACNKGGETLNEPKVNNIPESVKHDPEKEVGNTSANLLGLGLAASYGDEIFYINFGMTLNGNMQIGGDRCIYKMNADGSGVTRIQELPNSYNVFSLNVAAGYIYCLSSVSQSLDKLMLYKMKIDGSDIQAITMPDNVTGISVVGSWVYYWGNDGIFKTNGETTQTVYMLTEGETKSSGKSNTGTIGTWMTGDEQTIEQKADYEWLYADVDFVYFKLCTDNGDTASLCKVPLSGGEKIILPATITPEDRLIYQDGKIFVISEGKRSFTAVVTDLTTGQVSAPISMGQDAGFSVLGDYLFKSFSDFAGDFSDVAKIKMIGKLLKTKYSMDGSTAGVEDLIVDNIDGFIGSINIVGDWLFFSTMSIVPSMDSDFYRIRMDRTNLTKISGTEYNGTENSADDLYKMLPQDTQDEIQRVLPQAGGRR